MPALDAARRGCSSAATPPRRRGPAGPFTDDRTADASLVLAQLTT